MGGNECHDIAIHHSPSHWILTTGTRDLQLRRLREREAESRPWIEDACRGAPHYARLVPGPADQVLAWTAEAVAQGARVTQAAGLRDGGNPWLLRLVRAGREYRAVLKTGDPASARD